MRAVSDVREAEGSEERLHTVQSLREELGHCAYTEYDQDTGETYGCALKAHSGKVKHVRGGRVHG